MEGQNTNRTNKILTAVFVFCLALFIITFSISLPINLRFFYYLQIRPLNLENQSSYTYEQIVTAYDQVMNFLTLPWVTEFRCGDIPYSQSGEAHFFDVKVLFNLNNIVFMCSFVVIFVFLILNKKKKIVFSKPFGFNSSVISALCVLLLVLVLGIVIACNFDFAFTLFHKVFFPGKDNWIFSTITDPIIKILPERFFLNCAILIISSVIIFSVAILIKNRKREK